MSLPGAARDVLNTALRPLNMQVVRGRSTDPAVRNFIPARRTIAEARAAGLSVGDYIDHTFAAPGATAQTVEAMLRLSDLSSARRICEIGAGTGRYAEKVLAALEPDVYEVYETAPDWVRHLARLPHVVVQASDGHTLRPTASGSIDLVHAHKTFVDMPFDAVIGYLHEMVRVARPGGAIAFDVITETCLTDEVLSVWIDEGTIFRPLPRGWLVDHLERRGASLVGSHLAPLVHGLTELLVFRRTED